MGETSFEWEKGMTFWTQGWCIILPSDKLVKVDVVNRWLGWWVFSFSLWCWIWASMLNLPVLLIKTMVLGGENWERSPPFCWKLHPVLMGSLKEISKNPLWPKLLRGFQTHLEHPKPSPPGKKEVNAEPFAVRNARRMCKELKSSTSLPRTMPKWYISEMAGNVLTKAKGKKSEWWSKWWDDSCISFLRKSSRNCKGRFSSGRHWC